MATKTVENIHSANNRDSAPQDVLWAVGVWSVILSLSPVVIFYVLMVN